MRNPKHELISKVYRKWMSDEKWIHISPYIDENGWFHENNMDYLLSYTGLNFDTLDTKGSSWYRPKGLKGIDDNNGWFLLNEDFSNVPNDNNYYKVGRFDKLGQFDELNPIKSYFIKEFLKDHKTFIPTHFKHADKPPVY